MINEYKNIMLKSTSNEKAKDLEGKIGIFAKNGKDVTFSVEDDKICIHIISFIGDFENPSYDEVWIRDAENFSDYTFVRE